MNRWSAPHDHRRKPQQAPKTFFRGKELEAMFKKWMKYWRLNSNVMAIRLETDKQKSKQPCDFILWHSNYNTGQKTLYFLDTKETYEKYFYPDQQPQTEQLKKAQYNGIVAGFIVWFRDDEEEMRTQRKNIRFITDIDSRSDRNSGVEFKHDRLFQ